MINCNKSTFTERLTVRRIKKQDVILRKATKNKALEKLAAYEDSGLEPDTVKWLARLGDAGADMLRVYTLLDVPQQIIILNEAWRLAGEPALTDHELTSVRERAETAAKKGIKQSG